MTAMFPTQESRMAFYNVLVFWARNASAEGFLWYQGEMHNTLEAKRWHWKSLEAAIKKMEECEFKAMFSLAKATWRKALNTLPGKDFAGQILAIEGQLRLVDPEPDTHQRTIIVVDALTALSNMISEYENSCLPQLLAQVGILEKRILAYLKTLGDKDLQTEWKEEILPWVLDARDGKLKSMSERLEAINNFLFSTDPRQPASMFQFREKLEATIAQKGAAQRMAKIDRDRRRHGRPKMLYA